MAEQIFVYGVLPSSELADRASEALIDASFPIEEISVVTLRREGAQSAPLEHRTAIPQGVAVGGASGAVLGLVLAAVVGPGTGLLASGPILAALQSAAGGAAFGGLVGALAGIGYWRAESELPAQSLQSGGVLVGVHVPPERCAEVSELLARSGAAQVHSSSGA